jgi:hypothetical protein
MASPKTKPQAKMYEHDTHANAANEYQPVGRVDEGQNRRGKMNGVNHRAKDAQ